jgi:Ni,Fe-hydrogenase III large subunit
VQIGGSALALDRDDVQPARAELAELRRQARRGWRELTFNSSFQDRLPDIGVVTAEDAERLGAVGPAARAAGIAADVRATSRRLAYDGFEPVVPEREAGDAQARLEQRALELWQTFDCLERLLDGPVQPSSAEPGSDERQIGVGRVESPRGATTCVLERDGDRVARVHLRTGSYANWPVVAHAAADNLLPDFPLINKSFELCYACADR